MAPMEAEFSAPGGQPMRSHLSLQSDLTNRMVTRLQKYLDHGLSISAACRAARISRRWYYSHRETIEAAKPTAASRQSA